MKPGSMSTITRRRKRRNRRGARQVAADVDQGRLRGDRLELLARRADDRLVRRAAGSPGPRARTGSVTRRTSARRRGRPAPSTRRAARRTRRRSRAARSPGPSSARTHASPPLPGLLRERPGDDDGASSPRPSSRAGAAAPARRRSAPRRAPAPRGCGARSRRRSPPLPPPPRRACEKVRRPSPVGSRLAEPGVLGEHRAGRSRGSRRCDR